LEWGDFLKFEINWGSRRDTETRRKTQRRVLATDINQMHTDKRELEFFVFLRDLCGLGG
jgi:hypothetical protein